MTEAEALSLALFLAAVFIGGVAFVFSRSRKAKRNMHGGSQPSDPTDKR